MRYQELTVGSSAEYSRVVSDREVMSFADITGDFNPVHVDDEAAAKSRFGGRIAHGMLSAGLISSAIANVLPGPGSIYLAQTLKFTAPVRLDDTVTVTLTVIELLSKNRVKLSTVCRNQKGEMVLDGEATILLDETI
jgi:3-hydroxybutyryl-CoA dehydratase